MTATTVTELYLLVTFRPRFDRLAEAKAQLQSMLKSTLTEPGCVHAFPSASG